MGNLKENPKLKEEIIDFVIQTLEDCELFVNVYEKGFAKERLLENFKILYTEGENHIAKGQYKLGTSGQMTLFSKGKNGNLLTLEDLRNENDLSTVLHEAIHAIFNKTSEECAMLGIKYGSGIHEKYNNGVELGRGLNEGFTNWVCIKAGLYTSSYEAFTGFAKILELAIGPENVMRFGGGSVVSHIPELMEMKAKDCWDLLAKIDTLYDYDHKSREYEDIVKMLKKHQEYKKSISEGVVYTENPTEEVNIDLTYKYILNDEQYLEYARNNNLNPELDETKIDYFSHIKDNYSKQAKELTTEIKSELFLKYFDKELAEILASGNVTLEQYEKYGNLSNLILGFRYNTSNNETLEKFDKSFEQLSEFFFKNLNNDISFSIEQGTLSIEQILKYREAVANGNWDAPRKFNEIISNQMLPENPNLYHSFFQALNSQNILENMSDYRFFELQTPNGEKANMFLDQKNGNHFSRFVQLAKPFTADQELENVERMIDITLTDLQSIQEIVKNFLTLKEKISQKNPKAKMQIVENIIISEIEGEDPTYYIIDGNEFVKAEAKEFFTRISPQKIKTENQDLKVEEIKIEELQLNTNFEFKNLQEQTDTNYPLETISKNPFKRFLNALKQKFFRKEDSQNSVTNLSDNASQKIENESKKFDNRLLVDIGKNQNITNTINPNSSKKEKTELEEELTK